MSQDKALDNAVVTMGVSATGLMSFRHGATESLGTETRWYCISTALHSALTHQDAYNTYVRILFVDFGSAFNTVRPSKLVIKLHNLGFSPSICNWLLDFLEP